GTVTRWLKKVGDTVAVDEPLVEVSTDKVDTEIPSPVAGVLQQILVQEDETIEVGAVLAVVGDGAAAEAPAPAAAPPASEPEAAVPAQPEAPAAPAAPVAETPAPTPPAPVAAPPAAPAPVAPPASVASPVAPPAPPVPVAAAPAAPAAATELESDPNYVTPIVRKLASDMGVDLARVTGTGIGGRIRKEDVIAAGSQAPAASATAASVPAAAPSAAASPLRGTSEPMTRLRKVLAERAVASMQQSAQLTTVVEVDVTAVAQLRDRVKADFLAKTGNKLSFMPFFTLAAAEALRAHPKINSTAEGENIVYHDGENISFAVDTERGLLTPVLRNTASMSIAELARQIADMAERTRNNQLKPDELSGGTFTVTNTGSRGALFDTPVVFLPQSAILGTGIVTKRPAVVKDASGNEAIAIRSMVYLALSYDHRIIDGADASRYLSDVKMRLEAGAFEPNLGI
ncbi:MAG: 2-oxoglutarate dehydrogenase, E2 component, dihydrolipoamide succinyltransferase, partial [Actinobacteria bacterium]|nr:2-oxoglutarate dehydrogenase, E2 component, dihydrolipoamide succinyltransferase [Actinomycetota bacterium]